MKRFLSVLLLLAGCLAQLREGRATPEYPHRVTQITDGDTLEVRGPRGNLIIRLIGVDTPEWHPTDKLTRDARRSGQDVGTIQVLGKRATDFVKGLLKGRSVRLEFGERRLDRHGRTLAYVYFQMPEDTFAQRVGTHFVNGHPPLDREYLLNEVLVKYGFAQVYTAAPFAYLEEFLRLQGEARAQERGLWRPDAEDRRLISVAEQASPRGAARPLEEGVLLRMDLPDPENQSLRHFRRSDGPLAVGGAIEASRLGLEDLRISGSAQFSAAGLVELKRALPEGVIDVDLRQESHGFLNGYPVSWFGPRDQANFGKDLRAVEQDEKRGLKEARRAGDVNAWVLQKTPRGIEKVSFPIQVREALREKDLVRQADFDYVRIPVTDHMRPTDAEVDRFLKFYRKLAPEKWLHFHCEGGDGRTTTFMTLADILKNGRRVPLEEIVRRQHLLGGIDLFQIPAPDGWKTEEAEARREFIRNFYRYVRSGTRLSWSDWVTGD